MLPQDHSKIAGPINIEVCFHHQEGQTQPASFPNTLDRRLLQRHASTVLFSPWDSNHQGLTYALCRQLVSLQSKRTNQPPKLSQQFQHSTSPDQDSFDTAT